jgi:uncharacterized protein
MFFRISLSCMLTGIISVGTALASKVEVGKTPSVLTLDKKNGGRLNGDAWVSSEMKGKTHILFYVDPDQKELNDDLAQALKKRKFETDQLKSVAVINMAATWAPNFVIERSLKQKQKEFAKTLYLKDFNSHLVKEWKLSDDSFVVVLCGADGKVLFRKDGKLDAAEIQKVIGLIEKQSPEVKK